MNKQSTIQSVPLLKQYLTTFVQQYINEYQEKFQHLPTIEHDEQWLSPCETGASIEHLSLWQPIEIKDTLSFDNVESALSITLHQDIKTYFTSIYSEQIDAYWDNNILTLLFAWNRDDFSRLQENMIGHLLMKQELKQRPTLFFAVTDDDEHIITLDNETGIVGLEKVGFEVHRKLSDSLSDFIKELTPRI